jgi:aspartyl-tRNA(Asn)/glutamyl-tRNA(Gln) amidotransferase subunit B
MSAYKPTIGLEIHAELKTRTKMFCDSRNDPEERHPNVNVCPVCLGHPGTLPVPNKQAIEHVIKVGLALGGRINPVTKFDRKNYFYPDLPKGYQISQYDKPLVEGGELNGVRVRRIHLEEDTGTLIHADGASLVDYNRSGIPLMELVTEPDLKSADSTTAFARELQLILRYLGVSEANMEKGEMRIEANVSLNMGTKVELKNINSFKAVHDAVAYELKRQEETLTKGEKLVQETRGWDEVKQRTVSQRSKEEAHDYRYFPEPDIPPFETAVFEPEKLRALLPELPAAKRARFAKEYGVDAVAADGLVAEKPLADYFENAVSEFKALGGKNARLVLNYLTSDLKGLMNAVGDAELKVDPEHFAHLVYLIEQGKFTSRNAKDILKKIYEGGVDPSELLESGEFHAISDEGVLVEAVRAVIAENPAAVADYKKGKTASMQFLIGKAMGRLKGRGKPETLREIFEKEMK